ncbi:MAG: hypothetical protein OEY51_12775, partial [Cyclobacteriaceae bacterium]|nr:hypothetical protein [Cyclobacteriaceae bacterium]
MTNNRQYRFVRGLEFKVIQLLMLCNIWFTGLRLYKNPFTSFHALKKLLIHGKKVNAGLTLRKAFYHQGKYGWNMFHPLWPSTAFNRFFYHHLEEMIPSGKNLSVRRLLLVAITKRCPLQCEHCSEGETLNKKDKLSYDQLERKMEDLVQS